MFATVPELEQYLQRTFTEEDEDRAFTFLELASGLIRSETQQMLSLIEDDTVTLRPRSQVVILPERPVVTVTAVTVDDSPVDYQVDKAAGILFLQLSWPLIETAKLWPGEVTVTYTHGYDPIPGDIRGVCLDVARRALENPHGYVQKTVGDVSVSHGSHSGLAVGLQLSDMEKRTLYPHRRVA